MSNKKKIVYIGSVGLIVVSGLIFIVFKQTFFESPECSGSNCVTVREDPKNICFWENGQMTSGTEVSINPDEYIFTQVPRDQLETYLKKAHTENRCVSREE